MRSMRERVGGALESDGRSGVDQELDGATRKFEVQVVTYLLMRAGCQPAREGSSHARLSRSNHFLTMLHWALACPLACPSAIRALLTVLGI